MKLGVSLSHLILVADTASDSSPIRSHVREYVCPSLGGPLVEKTSVNGGAIICKQNSVCMYNQGRSQGWSLGPKEPPRQRKIHLMVH